MLAQQLDRDKPLWEIWLVEGVEGNRFALICKTHHALVDGISGVDIVTVLFDLAPEGATPSEPEHRWLPAPMPSRTQLLSEALLERATVPSEIARSVRAVFRAPRQIAGGVRDSLVGRRRDGVGRHEPGAAEPLQLPASARTAASPGCGRTSRTSRRSRTGSAAR